MSRIFLRSVLMLFLTAFFISVLDGCTSGKKAFERGDYYQAVIEAVGRLKSKPDNRKAAEVLRKSYPSAVTYLDTEVANARAAGDPDQWRKAMRNYELINTLYEQIRLSPGALKVIPEPQTRFKEMAEARNLAAEEYYKSGLESMLKGTRGDSKKAFLDFTEALKLVPGYKDATEYANQALEDATFHVVVEPVVINKPGWDLESAVYGYRGNPFVRFYSQEQAEKTGLKRIDHYLSWGINRYVQSFPNITRSTREYLDSVKVGEEKVGGKVVPVMKKIRVKATLFEKTVEAGSSLKLVITDGASHGTVGNFDIFSSQVWSDQWMVYTGDTRALPLNLRQLIDKKELFPLESSLKNAVRQDLERKLAAKIASVYGSY